MNQEQERELWEAYLTWLGSLGMVKKITMDHLWQAFQAGYEAAPLEES